jgi:DNA-binding NtrC family response regulator
MYTEQSAKTVIVVGAKRPEPAIEKEMEARGITLRWARSIKAAAGLLNSGLDRTVIITELALRDGNWTDLVETVRCRSIPVLLVSPTSTAELWWDALECGVEDILPAPLSASRLCEYLESSSQRTSDRR